MNVLYRLPAARRLALAGALVAPAFLTPGCTDLDEETFGVIPSDQFYRTEAEVLAGVAPVYAQLRAALWAYHNLSQISSDETIVPTRGSDWFDAGRWLAIHRHTWDPGLVDLNDAWNDAFTGVARANVFLRALEDAATVVPNREVFIAEARALRAYYYYQLVDLFGDVPLVGDEAGEYLADPDNPPTQSARADVYEFIVSELEDVRGTLPAEWPGDFGRMTQGAADAMLANLFLNAPVFTGTVATGGLQPGGERLNDAIEAANRVIDSGRYELVEDWFSNFSPSNANHPEHLFVVQHLGQDGLGLTFPMRYMHYNQFSPSAWNGFATIAETYAAFDEDDGRRGIFLVGQAFSFETGEPINDRNGDPLFFDPEIPDPTQASEGAGVRIAKFPPDVAGNFEGNHNNDYAFFRLAEMYLIRAEAYARQGNVAGAVADLNTVRARVAPALNPADYNAGNILDAVLNERLFELMYEAKRRQDLIRFGRYNDALSTRGASAPFRVVFPIPQTQIDANPNLAQNTGY